MVNKKPLSGLPEQTPVDGWVFIHSVRTLTATTGKKYLSWEGLDAIGGTVKGTLFENKIHDNTLPQMNANEIWSASGIIGNGKNGLMVYADQMIKVTTEEDINEFTNLCVPTLPQEQITEYVEALEGYAKSIKDPGLNRLSASLWTYMKPFLWTIPAAKGVHEPFRGGLAKHTYEIVKAVDIKPVWDAGLSYDVLIFSAVYHDIGKVRTYTGTMGMTHEGKLLPHSMIALELIAAAVAVKNIVIDAKLLLHVKHCIASHHGPYGEQKPLTREAYVLHNADMLVSRLGHFTEIMKSGSVGNDGWGGNWDKVVDGYPYIPEMDNQQ